nr:BTB/POZ domain motif-containing [Pandoravirus massiliensis]
MAQSAKRILADMRHQHCDCLLEVRPCGADESATPTTITAHRAILARAAYFGALFRHVEPDRVDRRDADGTRICRSAYAIEMPFDPVTLAFVVECLYDDERLCTIVDCADPVDAIRVALFVEAPQYHVQCFVRVVTHALLTEIAVRTRDRLDAADARARLASFLWHMLASGLDPLVKTRLLGRAIGSVAEAERAAILTKHADLAPERFYHPPSRVGGAVTNDDGRQWRLIHLAFDNIEFVGGEKRVEWDGMIFSGFMAPTGRYGDGIRVVIKRAPCSLPTGDDTLRAVSMQSAVGYDVLDRVSIEPFWALVVDRTGDRERQEALYALSGRVLPQGASVIPDPSVWSKDDLHTLVTLTRRGHTTLPGCLEAYEVVLLVEELERHEAAC